MIDGGSGGLGGVRILGALLPFPRQELMQTGLRDFGDAGEDVGEPGFRVDIVEAGRHDEGGHDRGSVGTAIGAGEQPCLSSQSYCPFILPMSGRSWKST